MKSSKRLNDRLALVTGASRGIGRAVALGLAREGCHVVITARTVGALEELDDEIRKVGGKATILQLDLRKGERIDQLGPTLYQRWPKLDLFIANAAILGPLSPLPHVTADAWNSVMDINVAANWRLIRTLDPLLQRADGARALFVSCAASAADSAYWGLQAASKAAVEALARTYAQENKTTKLRVGLVDPGPVATGLRAKAYPGEKHETLTKPEEVAELFVELCAGKPFEQGHFARYADWVKAKRPAHKEEAAES